MAAAETIIEKKPHSSSTGLYLIGVYKLIEGIALAALGFGLLRLLHRDLSEELTHLARVIKADPENRYVHSILERLFAVSPRQLRDLSVGTFLYSVLRLTEGVGLMLNQIWAEYLTVITTALFIPVEIYEMWRHFTLLKLGIFAVNLFIIWILCRGLRKKMHASDAR